MAKVLLVEDDMMIRDLYKRQFLRAGYEIEAFERGQDAVESLKNNKYDIALLDIMLPAGMNGLQFFEVLKTDPTNGKIPVIILTNLGQDSVLNEGMKMGAKGYLIKSEHTPGEIIEATAKVLAGGTLTQ